MKNLRRIFAICVLALLVSFPVGAAHQLVIQHFDEQVTVNANGMIEVAEIIDAHFIGTNWHGMYRTIPVEYTTPEGFNYTLMLQLLSISDDNGKPLKYEQSREGRSTKFKI